MKVKMLLLQPVRLADRLQPAGAIMPLSLDAARHLEHQRRAVPADHAAAVALAAVPAVAGGA